MATPTPAPGASPFQNLSFAPTPSAPTPEPEAGGVVQPPLFGTIPAPEAVPTETDPAPTEPAPETEDTAPKPTPRKAAAKKATAKKSTADKPAPVTSVSPAAAPSAVPGGSGLNDLERQITGALVGLPPAVALKAARALAAYLTERAESAAGFLRLMVDGVPGDYGTFTVDDDGTVTPK